MNTRSLVCSCISMLLCSTLTHAIDNPHFWRATNFLPLFYEPRLQESWLTSLEVTLAGGHSNSGRNGNGQNCQLLDIYGYQNAAALGIGVPGKNPSNPNDSALNQVAALLPQPYPFGLFSYRGAFKVIESNISLAQNLAHGFFMQAHLPIRRFKVHDISYVDLTPTDQQTPTWQNFVTLYPSILQQYTINTGPISHTGIGDFSCYIGWTSNYENTQDLDYIDTSIRAGIVVPTGSTTSSLLAFDIANGYNGFTGFPIRVDGALGVYEWLTLGGHFNIMFFNHKDRTIRVTTSPLQSGFIQLTTAPATIRLGTLWEANLYIKADHMVGGLTFLIGYGLAYQGNSTIALNDPTLSTLLANLNPAYQSWSMHTLNCIGEYDFSSYDHPLAPRLSFFYNVIMGGKRIFNTNMVGGQVGFDISWCY